MRKCYKCEETKELTEFHNDRTQVEGKSYECKKCKSETRKQKRKENPEKYREACRISTKKNYDTIRASQKKHKLENREKILARRKELREPRKIEINIRESERKKLHRILRTSVWEIERRKSKENYKKNKEKKKIQINAHNLVRYAIKLGMMKKPDECSRCGSDRRVEAHHEDYAKPLDVQWLCKVCHVARHKEIE